MNEEIRICFSHYSARLASVAAAQSSVTLFGVVDAAMRYQKPTARASTAWHPAAAPHQPFGVRGIEDLGDPEGRFLAGRRFWHPSTGAFGSSFWARRAVSLISASMGGIRLSPFSRP
jgi:hypothetical protein